MRAGIPRLLLTNLSKFCAGEKMHLFLSPAPCEDVCSLKELVVSCQGNKRGDKWAPSVVALTLADESSL